MAKPAYEFFPATDVPWTQVPGSECEGLTERVLAVDEGKGVATRMLRFAPGTDTTPNGVLTHDFWEEVYILEGSIHDLELDKTFIAGTYACRPPGMKHGPWVSADGCVTFEVRYASRLEAPTSAATGQPASRRAPHETLSALAKVTEQFLRTVAELRPEQLGEPSALPGWTRGHVLSHISRSADSMTNLLTGARTGEHIPHYASAEAREQGIQDGADRPLLAQLADLRESAARFAVAAAAMPEESWPFEVRHLLGFTFPAWEIPWRRLAEVEYHLVDLDVGYTPARWPAYFVAEELERLAVRLRGVEGIPVMLLRVEGTEKTFRVGEGSIGRHIPVSFVEGPGHALVAWLSGRSNGQGLEVYRDGNKLADPLRALPELPPFG